MFVANYIGLLYKSENDLRDAFLRISDEHKDEPDIEEVCKELASWSEVHVNNMQNVVKCYNEHKEDEPDNLLKTLFHGTRTGGLGLLRDMHDLYLLASEVELAYTVILQASLALRDSELEYLCKDSMKETTRQINWIKTRIKQAAPQSLVAA